MHRPKSSHSAAASSRRSRRSSSPGSRGSRSRSVRSRSRSRRQRRSPSPRDRRRSRRSPSPRRARRRHSLDRHSRSPLQRSPSWRSKCSVEHNLRITVGNDGIETPQRRRLSDRLGSPVDNLSDVDRDDFAYGPVLSRYPSHPQSPEQHLFCEENPSSPFGTRHDKDYRSRNVFVYQPDCTINYNHLQDQRRETDWDGEKNLQCDRDDFLSGTQKYCKRMFSRNPSPSYLDEDFHALEIARRKREELELKKKLIREPPGNSYMFPESTKSVQPYEPLYLHRPEEAPAMPRKSILKKRAEDPSVQPRSSNSLSMDVDNFLKQFNKNVVTKSAVSKESQVPVHDWKQHSGQQHSASFEQNSDNFSMQKKHHVSALEPSDQQSNFWLPRERASQDGRGFSRIPCMMTDSASTQEERRYSFPGETEDEENFLYGSGDENDFRINFSSAAELTLTDRKGTVKQKVSSLSLPSSSVNVDISEESQSEYEKIHDMLKTIGLDIEVAEISKLAARTQERLHGKKRSRSPDRPLVVSHKSGSQERHRSRSDTHSPESSRKYSLSPPSSFPPSKDMSSVSISDCNNSKTVGQDSPLGTVEQVIPSAPIIPSAPPCLPNLFPSPASLAWYNIPHFPPFTATQLPQNYPSLTMPSPGCFAYGQHMTYAASSWPLYTQQIVPALSGIHKFLTPTMPVDFSRPNLSVTGKAPPNIKRDESVFVQIPTCAQDSKLLPQLSLAGLKGAKERVSDKKNRAFQRQKVTMEREKLKCEQEARQKQLYYLKIELNRLSRVQEEMLQKKCKEKDPLLLEVSKLQESIAKEIAELEIKASVAEKKKSELDTVAQILGINIFEKSQKLSSDNKESSDKSMSVDAKNERTLISIKS
ncbi:zinc finger protein 318-like [Sceloporus undulatus]|uniref:zinc finger protein 318-like n=1 Tax=Sceloporus undulatus TaxID=8520 RepID=UPI001C4C7320|nr:zinc finger protein 318-like [Sceloporus undulatus]